MITTRADLDALEGTDEHDAFMAMLAGSLFRTEYDVTAKRWVVTEDDALISQFGFVKADFPGASPPDVSGIPLPTPVDATTTASPNLRPALWAAAYDVTVEDGVIGNIEIASVISGAVYIDVGCYWVFLAETIDPALYRPKVFDALARMKVTEKYGDYFVISSLDAGGNSFDPETFSIEIVRFS